MVKKEEPFLGRTFAPDFMRYGRSTKIIERSRERYTMPRAVVEDKIRRWMESAVTGHSRNGLRRENVVRKNRTHKGMR
jgi:hypothetical protein